MKSFLSLHMVPWSVPVKTEQWPPTLRGKLWQHSVLSASVASASVASERYKLIATFLTVATRYPTKATFKKEGLILALGCP